MGHPPPPRAPQGQVHLLLRVLGGTSTLGLRPWLLPRAALTSWHSEVLLQPWGPLLPAAAVRLLALWALRVPSAASAGQGPSLLLALCSYVLRAEHLRAAPVPVS